MENGWIFSEKSGLFLLSSLYLAQKTMQIAWWDAGKFYADGGAMFGAVPKTAWSRRYPSDGRNGCVLSMRCGLVLTGDGRRILIDNGVGDRHIGSLAYYRFFDRKDVGEELMRRGVRVEEITDVVLTHLHFDHCGYTVRREPESGRLVPAFPNARCWVGRAQWENFLDPHPLESGSYFPDDLLPVHSAGLLRLVDADTELAPGVRLRLFDGHTPGQLVPYVDLPERTVVFAGDVVPLAASVSPEWISAYDTQPLVSYREKIRLLEEAAQGRHLLVYGHDAYTPASEVKKAGRFYKAVNPCGAAPAGLLFVDDFFAERRKRQCGQLEMLYSERNADNGDAQEQSERQVGKADPDAAQYNP